MATVLIIYYKQVAEGYDDKERFEIMQKVGMSRKEVMKSINSNNNSLRYIVFNRLFIYSKDIL